MDENTDEQQEFFVPQHTEKAGNRSVNALIPSLVRLMAIFLVGVIFGNVLWLLTADVLAFGREDQAVEISVSETDTIKDISKNLKQKGLINYAWLFRLYAKVTHAQAKIKPGTYTLQTRYDYHALVKALSAGKVQRTLSFETNQGVIEIKWLNWNY